MAIADLKILLSMSSDKLRSQLKTVSAVISSELGELHKLGSMIDKIGSGQGNLFRAPTGNGEQTQFASAAQAATAFQKVLDGVERQLDAFQNTMYKITAPLRDSAARSLEAAVAMQKQSASLVAFQRAMGATVVPIGAFNASISTAKANVLGMTAPLSTLSKSLSFFNLVNYNVRDSVESWNALAVIRGPGVLVQFADKINQFVFGMQPPVRALQFILTKFLIPALVSLGIALQGLANNPAAKILGENLIVLAAQMKNLGQSYVLTILTKMAMGFKLIGSASISAVKSIWGFLNLPVGQAFSQMATGVLRTAQALAALAARATVYGAIKAIELAARLLAKTAQLAASAVWRFAKSLASIAGNAAKSAANVLSLGMAFRKSAKDADEFNKATSKASSGFSRWSMLPGIISPSLGMLAGLGAAVGGVALAFKAASMGINTAINTEQSVLQFETLLGSAQAAQDRIADLSKFAADTPFTMPDVINANRLLQTFGGNALADGKILTMVGDMAAGAGQDLSSVAMWVGRLYSGLKAGKPIGEAVMRLREMGLITPELEKDFSKLAESDPAKAFEEFQKSMGRFSGVMQKQSQSVGGLLSTLGDSVSLFFGDLMKGLIDGFNIRGALAGIIGAFDWARANLVQPVVAMVNGFVAPFMAGVKMVSGFVSSNLPVILQTFRVVFTSIYATVSSVMTTVYDVIVTPLMGVANWVGGAFASMFGGTFSNIMLTVSKAFWTIEYAVKNWQATLQVAVLGASLGVVTFANIVVHWFTVALPEYLMWFGRNWKNIFTDIFNGTVAIFTNLFSNVKNFFTQLWNFIATKGASGFNFTWTPLLDGFKAVTEQLPQIAEREMGPLEKSLTDQFNKASKDYNSGLNGFIADKVKGLEEEQKKANGQLAQGIQNMPKPGDIPGIYDGFVGQGKGGGSKIEAGASALQRGSEAAQAALSRSVGTGDPMIKGQNQLIQQAKQQTTILNKMLANGGVQKLQVVTI